MNALIANRDDGVCRLSVWHFSSKTGGHRQITVMLPVVQVTALWSELSDV
uniref:Neur_chan_LBD domain-containing protein n=1 Tax=Ascaris lumbricoides TaxID=6252 RepID=A0A0M3IIX1_ASCLU